MNDYADLTTIRSDEPTPTVLALCDAVEWMRDRLVELGDAPSLERFHRRDDMSHARDLAIEAGARAAYDARHGEFAFWDGAEDHIRDFWRDQATAFLAAGWTPPEGEKT